MVPQEIPWEGCEAEIRKRFAKAPSVSIAAATHELGELARASELSLVDPEELSEFLVILKETDSASGDLP